MKRPITMEKYNYNTALKKANLVERNFCPNRATMLNPLRVSMHDEQDIITLAQQIQKADEAVKNSACGKLSVILEQDMKRPITMEKYNYNTALKKANLVDRNFCPNGATMLNPLRVSMHDEQDIITLAQQIQKADEAVKNSACGKLSVILEQIRFLQAQAKKILEETERNNTLNNAACNFTKKPGTIYHLYQRESGQNYFSMLSPEEWNGASKHKFLGSFRLETDMTWTPTGQIAERNEIFAITEKILNADKEKSLAIEYFN